MLPKENLLDDVVNNIENNLVKEAMNAGRIPIGYTCSFVPEVLLSVDKLFPLRLHAPNITGTSSADVYMPPVVCSYCRSLLEFGMNGHYDFLGGWVFNFSCQHMNRCADLIQHSVKPKFVHVLDALHSNTENTISWMVDELKILSDKLSSHFNVEINEESLSTAIIKHNEFILIMGEIGDLRKLDNPPITGTEFHKLMIASQVSPKDLLRKTVEALRDDIKKRDGVKDYRARLMILGGILDDPKFIESIEDVGCLVVGDHFCTGSVPGLNIIPEGPHGPLERIARHTMAKPCPRMFDPIDNRLDSVLQTVKEYNVDGVIIEQLKFCDPMNYYGLAMKEYLNDSGIPVLRIDREYRLSGEGQLKTRVQAFIESMGK